MFLLEAICMQCGVTIDSLLMRIGSQPGIVIIKLVLDQQAKSVVSLSFPVILVCHNHSSLSCRLSLP